MSSFEGCWTISPASIDWTALNLCSGCSQSHLTLKQVCPVPLPWLTLHSTTRSPRAVMRHLISSFLPLTNRQIMVYGSLLLAINLVRGSFPATQACHCHGVPSALGWHLAHCAHSLDVPDLSLKSRQQVVEIARNCLQHASEHRLMQNVQHASVQLPRALLHVLRYGTVWHGMILCALPVSEFRRSHRWIRCPIHSLAPWSSLRSSRRRRFRQYSYLGFKWRAILQKCGNQSQQLIHTHSAKKVVITKPGVFRWFGLAQLWIPNDLNPWSLHLEGEARESSKFAKDSAAWRSSSSLPGRGPGGL